MYSHITISVFCCSSLRNTVKKETNNSQLPSVSWARHLWTKSIMYWRFSLLNLHFCLISSYFVLCLMFYNVLVNNSVFFCTVIHSLRSIRNRLLNSLIFSIIFSWIVKYKIIYRIETGILQQSGNQSNKQFTG